MREVDAVFFLVDPLAPNLSTADLIIMAFARLEELQSIDVIP